MKATGILLGVLSVAVAVVVVAKPESPVAAHVSAHAMEPAWMIVSGATLLVIAGVVRRFIP